MNSFNVRFIFWVYNSFKCFMLKKLKSTTTTKKKSMNKISEVPKQLQI